MSDQKDQDRLAEPLSVLEWARERYENTIRIAVQKTGVDRAGWLVDGSYWLAIVVVIEEHARLTQENARLKAELSAVDEALARRPALEDMATRYAKIEHACSTAGRADRLAGELESLKAKFAAPSA